MKLVLLLAFAVTIFAEKRKLPWEKNRLRVGQDLYRENCVVCHDIDQAQKDSKKLGPSFYQLFQRTRMPIANQPPSRAYVQTRIRFGGALMPAFQKKMTPAEMETLLDYMESRRRTQNTELRTHHSE
jgi:mono/diheme cytochrome c family protein